MSTMIRIYVACLASYNNGVLYGAWLDSVLDAEDLKNDVATMLRGSKYPNVMVACPACEGRIYCDGQGIDLPCETCNGSNQVPSAEEWAIHDHEGFEGIQIGESESLDRVAAIAEALDNASDSEAFAHFYNNGSIARDADAKDMSAAFDDAYRGTYRTLADYAEEVTRECHDDIPDWLDRYINWESVGRDMELGGDIWTADGGEGVYVFSNC